MARKNSLANKKRCLFERRKSIKKRMKLIRENKNKNSNVQGASRDEPSTSTIDIVDHEVISNQSLGSAKSSPRSCHYNISSASDNNLVDLSTSPLSSAKVSSATAGPLEKDQSEVSGRRLVDIASFFTELNDFRHMGLFNCGNSYLKIEKEISTGFQSTFVVRCSICHEEKRIHNDVSGPTDINKQMVLGFVSTGGSYSQMKEVFSYCDVPTMSSKLFLKIQDEVADVIHDTVWDLIKAAGEEEKRLAIEKGRVDPDGIPYITVIADGAWSKRSYKVNYNALSGVAVIIGQETRKILFLGIKNKYCCICDRASNKDVEARQHVCYKNWNKASTAMESEIIVEGFHKSIDMHGIKYGYLVGDGDSSVTKKLADTRPYQNKPVQKIECRNHLFRNFCNRLKELTQRRTSSKQNVVPVKERNVLSGSIKRIRNGIVGAVQHYITAQDLSHSQKIIHLKQDITNTPHHVFGDHANCKPYFCNGPREIEYNWTTAMKHSGLFQDILAVNERLVRNAESLIINMNNNAAELYNSMLAKVIGGKRINYSLKRSYETRCEKAAISYNIGAQTSRVLVKSICNRSPGKIHKKYIRSMEKRATWVNTRKQQLFSASSKKKKQTEAPADEDYGLPSTDEIDDTTYQARKQTFMDSISMDEAEAQTLEHETIGQANTLLWMEERSKRITASNFGKICKLRKTTHCSNIVKNMLYSTFTGNAATQWGKEHEKIAIQEFENITGLKVKECGLFVSTEFSYLGASPDGLIDDYGIIEVKCPKTCIKKTPQEGIKDKNIKFATLENNFIKLKRSDNYYFQIQGQLQITKRRYCYFIIWTPLKMEFEKIYRDDQFWAEKMYEQLKTFYFKCLLPEIIDPQYINKRKIKDLRFEEGVGSNQPTNKTPEIPV